MNQTDYIKEALISKCVNSFIEAVLKTNSLDLSENTANVSDWGQAVLAAFAIKDKVEFINTDLIKENQ